MQGLFAADLGAVQIHKGRIICALSQTDPMINLYDTLCSHCLCHFLKSGNIGTYHIVLLKSIFL